MVCNGVIEPEKLQPRDEAAKYHGFRAHLQVVEWKMLDQRFNLSPTEWGWKEMITSQNKKYLTPVRTSKAVALENLLEVTRCRCEAKKNQCGANVCTCRKHGIKCMAACGGCHGETCNNKMVIGSF